MKKLISIHFVIPIIIFGIVIISCNSQTCINLPEKYESYESALKLIKTSTFQIDENCDTSKSSWIRNAHFFFMR